MITWWKKDPIRTLKRLLGKDKVLTSAESLAIYGVDGTTLTGNPLAVVLAEEVEDIQDTVDFAKDNGIPITPRGAGSGLSGGSVPLSGGIVLSCERMKTIEKLDPNAGTAIVQPGVVTEQLQREAAKHNLYYPPDPSSFNVSTIAGNVSENAGGLRCFKYGVTGHYVLGIEYVDCEGEIQKTGIFGTKVFEPDVTALLVGSEGTLGVFSRISLRLVPLPESTGTISACFKDIQDSLETVQEIINLGLTPSVIEFIDSKSLSAASKYIGESYPADAGAMLLLEVDGSVDEVKESLERVETQLRERAIEVVISTESSEREKLWKLRRAVSPSLSRLSSGLIHEDIAVPRGKIVEMSHLLSRIDEIPEIDIALYGHAGDGNLHVQILFNASDRNSVSNAEKAAEEVFKGAISLGGTISGEHGIGRSKRDYLHWQLSDVNIQLSRDIKKTFDPNGIFNPGKILTPIFR